MQSLENISIQIESIHSYFADYANSQVNYAYTLRNWLIGMYLFEVEQKGQNRAEYGEKLYKSIAERLKNKKIKGMSFTFLNTCKQFYLVYPQIIQTVSEKSFKIENQVLEIVQSLYEQLKKERFQVKTEPNFKQKIFFLNKKNHAI